MIIIKEEVEKLLPHIRAAMEAYKVFHRELDKYKKMDVNELYNESPIIFKLVVKLIESELDEMKFLYE